MGKNNAGWQILPKRNKLCSNPEKAELISCSGITISSKQLKVTCREISQYIFELISLGNFFGMLSSVGCDLIQLNSDKSSSSFSPSQCCPPIWASGEFLRLQLKLFPPWTGSRSPGRWRPSTAAAGEPEAAGQVCCNFTSKGWLLTHLLLVTWGMKGVAQADQTAVDRLILSSKAVLMRSIDWLTIVIDQERQTD